MFGKASLPSFVTSMKYIYLLIWVSQPKSNTVVQFFWQLQRKVKSPLDKRETRLTCNHLKMEQNLPSLPEIIKSHFPITQSTSLSACQISLLN